MQQITTLAMNPKDIEIKLNEVFLPSDKIVAREIEGELLIIPIGEGLADLNDEMFSLNGTGLIIWKKLHPDNDVETICRDLAQHYYASLDVIKTDVTGFLKMLIAKKIITKIPRV